VPEEETVQEFLNGITDADLKMLKPVVSSNLVYKQDFNRCSDLIRDEHMDMLINKPGGRAHIAEVSTGGRGGGRAWTRGGKGSGEGNAGRGGKSGKLKQGDN
jgi:hypothetical protein